MFSPLFDNTEKGSWVYPKRTVCEVHREIYDVLVLELAEKHKDILLKIIPLLEEVYIIGIKMNQKLIENKLKYDWKKNNATIEIRKRRVMLIKVLEENNKILRKHEDSNCLLS